MHNIYISVNNYCLSSEQLGQRHRCFCQAQRDFSKLSNDIISVQTGKYKSWTYHDMDSIYDSSRKTICPCNDIKNNTKVKVSD